MNKENFHGTLPNSNETFDEWETKSLNVINGVCSLFTLPIEQILRPRYGTRYFKPMIVFLSAILNFMIMPLFGSFVGSVVGFAGSVVGIRPAGGFSLIGFSTVTFVFFIVSVLHNIRLWYLMLHPLKEEIAEYEGPPLPFFRLLPKGNNFWFVRCVWEPVSLMVGSVLLSDFHIIDHVVRMYLCFIAVCLFFKNYIDWYRAWLYIRRMLDAQAIGLRLAAVMAGTATPEDAAKLHIAEPPKSIPQTTKDAIVRQRATDMSPSLKNLVSPLDTESVGGA